MFKKPKRNFRARQVRNSESEEEHEDKGLQHDGKSQVQESQAEATVLPTLQPKPVPVAKPKINNTDKLTIDKEDKPSGKFHKSSSVLSFEDDEEESHTFKVKKSSHSKRIAKQLKKESKKEKEENEKRQKEAEEKAKREAEQRAKMHIKSSSESDGSNSPNGYHSYSDSENSESEKGNSKHFSPFQSVLQTGQIPDAHMIHMARKKRQQAREQQDFIPLDDEPPENTKSRLIREEDHDLSDEGEEGSRLNFAVDSRDQELRKMQRTINEAMEDGSDHENEWEEQQIRKGVNILMPTSVSGQAENNASFEQFVYNQAGGLFNSNGTSYASTSQHPKSDLSKPLDIQQLDLEGVSKSIKERLEEVTSVYRTHVHERDDTESRLEQCQEGIEKCQSEKPRLEKQYRFYQEMRMFTRNLVECLNEKVPQIEYLERCMHHHLKARAERLAKRRQEDVKDQSDDSSAVGKSNVPVAAPNPEKQRRVAEREARRNRRRRGRESQGIARHDDGMSTDDEENNSEIAKYSVERERISEDSKTIFNDVNEEFSDLGVIKRRFEQWEELQPDSYSEAYIALCLPKLFTPFVKLALIDWNPLEEGCKNFEEMEWFESLMFYGCRDREDLQPDDNDIKLIPSLIEKVLVPKLTGLVEHVWDPLSSRQTLKLVRLIHKLLSDYPTVNHESKNTQALMTAVHKRLRKTLDDDVFIPLFPKQVLENKNQGPALFFQRQFWTCVKLLGNIFSWHGLLSDKTLMELGLDSLLNRYMVLSLLNSPGNKETVYKCQQITSTLPKSWFKELEGTSTLPQLENLCRFLLSAAASLSKTMEGGRDFEKKEARELIKQISKLLVNIHATDHALTLSSQYSLSIKL